MASRSTSERESARKLFLRSPLARRVATLFVLSALVPLGTFAAYSYTSVSSQLERDARERLRLEAKTTGMSLLERLMIAQASLEQTALDADDGDLIQQIEGSRPFVAAWFEPLAGAVEHAHWLDADQRERVVRGAPTLVERSRPGGVTVALAIAAPDQRALVAELDPGYVVPDAVRSGSNQLEIAIGGRSYLRDGAPAAPELVRGAAEGGSGSTEWSRGDATFLGSYWTLFLRSSLAAPSWMIASSLPRGELLAPMRSFQQTFLQVAALASVGVLLSSLALLRRSLTPLSLLQSGARRLGQGDLRARVAASGTGEIRELGEAFNDMASGLEHHVEALSGMSALTLRAAAGDLGPLGLLGEAAAAVEAVLGAECRIFARVEGDWIRANALGHAVAAAPPEEIVEQLARRVMVEATGAEAERLFGAPTERPEASLLGFPIVSAEGLWGGIFAWRGDSDQADTDLEFLGAVSHLLATSLDRMRAERELRESRDQLHQSQKLEALGRLAGGVAHDFNNLLTAIKGYGVLAAERAEPGSELAEEIGEIRKAADQAAGLTGQLLAFGRKRPIQPQPVCLDGLAGDMQRLLAGVLPDTVSLSLALAARDAWIEADPTQIQQVLMNLVVNARDAMAGSGRIELRTRAFELGGAAEGRFGRFEVGRYVCLSVRDTGCGMDEVTLGKIFEPFFSTKGEKGNGLGLATVYGVVQQGGGEIRVSSEVGVGTCFELAWPAIAAPADADPAGPPGDTDSTANAVVLLVEDERAIRRIAARVLKRAGYTVLEAEDGAAAVALAASGESAIDLLLTDVALPGMQGPEVEQRVRQHHPAVRCVFASGHTGSAFEDGDPRHFLPKPYEPEDLLRIVAEALQSDADAR